MLNPQRRALPPAVAHLVLVRPMRWPFLLIFASDILFGVAACTSFTAYTHDIQIYDNEYPLSSNDLREIQRLSLSAGIKKPIAHISTHRADEVSVICGGLNLRSTDLVYFTARRRHGHWFIDKSTIETRRETEDDRVVVE
jgi:hypothetical protein